MITQVLNENSTQTFYCLSTDTKPTYADNGSDLYEIDTGKSYKFNEATSAWVEQPGGGGGGSAIIPPQTYMANCSTRANVAEKIVTVSNSSSFPSVLTDGICVGIRFSKNNTQDTITLNVNGTGGKYAVTKNYDDVGKWDSARIMFFTYDEKQDSWIHECEQEATTEIPGVVRLSSDISSTSETDAATIKAVHTVSQTISNYLPRITTPSPGNIVVYATSVGGNQMSPKVVDNIPTENSTSFVTSGGVYEAIRSAIGSLSTLLGSGVYDDNPT